MTATTSESPGPGGRLFISHAGRDRAWAEWVGWNLQEAGYAVELDAWDWAIGDNFLLRMQGALENTDAIVALYSEAYFERSVYTTEEWAGLLVTAQGDDRPQPRLIPLRIEDVRVPPLLQTLITADLFGLESNSAREVLLGAVRGTSPMTEPQFPGSSAAGSGPARPLPGQLPPVWNLPARRFGFVGRDSALIRLREGFSSGLSAQVLAGMGGAGKSQLAIEYAYRFASDYDVVWWVDAEPSELIGGQLAALAVAMGLVDPDRETPAAVQALMAGLRTRSRWLLIFDHAEEGEVLLPWLLSGHGHTLITSRNRRWRSIGPAIELIGFSRAESVALLRSAVPSLNYQEADELAHQLGDLPLALAQAGGLLAETGMPARDYLELLSTNAADVLDLATPIGSSPLSRALALSMDRLAYEDPAAAHLMRLCACLAPEPIPLTLFSDAPDDVLSEPLASVVRTGLALRRVIGRIDRFALAQAGENDIQLHRLVQAMLRQQDVHSSAAIQAEVSSILVSANPGDPDDPATWGAWAVLLPHVLAVDLEGTDNSQLRRMAGELTWYLNRRADIQAARDLARRLYERWLSLYGIEQTHTLYVAQSLAQSWRNLGEFERARELDTKILEVRRRIRGNDHPNTLRSAHNLAIDLRELGFLDEARALDESTLERKRAVLGPEHPATLNSSHNLASDLRMLGLAQDARELDEKTLIARRATLGNDHPDTLSSVLSLATDLRALDLLTEARELHEQAFAGYRQVLGNDHPDTLSAAYGLALALKGSDDLPGSRELAADIHTRRLQVLGEAHRDTKLIASLIKELGR